MILTRDKGIILPILNEDLGAHNNGEPIPDGFIDRKDKLFLYEDGCLFPTTIRDDVMVANIHAAIPSEKRGKAAVEAAKLCLKWLTDQGYTVISTIERDRREVRLFARLCGMKYINDHNEYRVYTWAA